MKKKKFTKLLILSIVIMIIGIIAIIYAYTDTEQIEIISGVYKSKANQSALEFGGFAFVVGISGIITSIILKVSVNKASSIKENKQKKLMKKTL